MMIMDGSADQGLIVHEAGHNYTMGLLANNEWREGWLDEGFTSFQTHLVLGGHRAGRAATAETEADVLLLDLDGGRSRRVCAAEAYRDFNSYNIAIYTRGELFFHQLRHIVGDETMHRILRTFYERWKYRHVDEAAFRAVAEEVSRSGTSPRFFAQWLHTTELYDYAVGKVKRAGRATAGSPGSRSCARRPAGIPVDVAVLAEGDTAVARADGLAEREWVELRDPDAAAAGDARSAGARATTGTC